MPHTNSANYPKEDWDEKSFSNGDLRFFLNQARALNELFDREISAGYSFDKSVNTDLICREACDKYPLDERHETNVRGVARRTIKLKQIIDFLVRKYGLDEKGHIADPRGLYYAIFDKKAPETVEAWPYALSIGFSMPRRHFKLRGKGEASDRGGSAGQTGIGPSGWR